MSDEKRISVSKPKKRFRSLIIFAIFCIIMVWMHYGESISLNMYKGRVKRYVEQQEYSEEKEEILFITIDHIRTPELISDYKNIYVGRFPLPSGSYSLVTEDGTYKDIFVDENDWHVVIGDTGLHRYFNAVIDETTLEFLGSIPIA